MSTSNAEVWGTLLCGHSLLICDPDMDAAGSEFCSLCGLWSSFSGFFKSRGAAS